MKSVVVGWVCVLMFLYAPSSQAGDITLPGMIAGGGTARIRTTSVKELRFKATVRQQYDYSCGSAALATLLTYHYGDPISEELAFKFMWDHGDQEKIRREGFSLLDIKEYLEANGYRANGYLVPLDKLVEVGIPAIALIQENGYNHFVVIKGVQGRKVLVGDPSVGGRIMTRHEFEKMWTNGILFAIIGRREQVVFNDANDWQIRSKAPLGLTISPSNLANIGLLRRGPEDF